MRQCFLIISLIALYLSPFVANAQSPGGVSVDLEVWLKADVGVLDSGAAAASDGDGVATWQDQSGARTNDATDANMSSPTYRDNTTDNINSNPVLEFDAVDDGLNFGDDFVFSTGDGLSIFALVAPSVSGNNKFVYDFGNFPNTGYGFRYSRTSILGHTPLNFGGAVTALVDHGHDISPVVSAFTIDFGDSESVFTNGTLATSTSITTSQLTAAEISASSTPQNNEGPVSIGRQSKNASLSGRLYGGRMAEVIVYSKNITAVNKNKIESYLALKYGITLATTTNYIDSAGTTIWSLSGNADYYNDVTGIGRDDGSGLTQATSTSVNGDAVTIGAIAALSDQTYLLWGNDDDATTSWQTTGVPSGYRRVAREWRVQETGSVSTVTLTTTESDVPSFGGSLYLIVDTDGDDGLGDETPRVMTNTSGTTWAIDYDFSTGQEFTLASQFLTVTIAESTAGAEPSTDAVFTVSLDTTNETGSAIEVTYNFTGGSATGGVDYTNSTSTPVSIASGSQSNTLTVPILDDSDTEDEETIVVTLLSATGPSRILSNGTEVATTTISDNDGGTISGGISARARQQQKESIIVSVLNVTNALEAVVPLFRIVDDPAIKFILVRVLEDLLDSFLKLAR